MNLIEILKGVSEGIYKSIILDEEVEKVSQERLQICKDCEFNSTQGKIVNSSKCTGCGCFLKLKSRVLSADCGLKVYNEKHQTNYPLRWTAVVDEETENKINEII